jgi:hypothetical protein
MTVIVATHKALSVERQRTSVPITQLIRVDGSFFQERNHDFADP